MKPPTATIRQLFLHASAACVLVFLPAFAAGCGAAGETAREESAAAPDTTIALRLRIDSLTMENTFLKKELETLRQDARGTAMRAAELESQIAGRQEERDLPPPPPEQLASTAPPATEPAMPPPPAPATGMKAQPAYEEGLRLFRARNYNAAFTIFQSLVTGGAPGDLADRCHYWSGECAYALKQYQNAIGHFETVLGFPR